MSEVKCCLVPPGKGVYSNGKGVSGQRFLLNFLDL
jgi:hypothetical protein